MILNFYQAYLAAKSGIDIPVLNSSRTIVVNVQDRKKTMTTLSCYRRCEVRCLLGTLNLDSKENWNKPQTLKNYVDDIA